LAEVTGLAAGPDHRERKGSVNGDEGGVRWGDELVGQGCRVSEFIEVGDVRVNNRGNTDRLAGHTAFARGRGGGLGFPHDVRRGDSRGRRCGRIPVVA
jgi:hypothetical protein